MKISLKRIITVILTIICLVSSTAFAQIVDVTDQAMRVVSLDKPAERIVSCYYISTATLLALGLEDSLVGIEMKADTRGLYSLAAEDIIALPAVGSGKGINIEEIAELDPDIVIVPKKLKDSVDQLAELGIYSVVVNPESQAQFEECVTLLGAVGGRADEAEALLALYAGITEQVSAAVSGLEAPRVYMAAGSDVFTTFPAGLYQNDLITIAGGINVAGELEGDKKATVDAEQLLAWDPEYIFIVTDADYTVEDVMNDPQLSEITAVKNGNVFAFPSDIEAWDYPTPSSVLGQAYLASVLHPEAISFDQFMEIAADFYMNVFGVEITAEQLGIAE